MKHILLIAFAFVAFQANAQKEYKVSHNSGKIILAGLDDVDVTAYDGSEVIITAHIDHDDEDSNRAAGLKMINSAGLDDNTGLGLSANKEGADLLVTQIGECSCSDGEGYQIKIPRSMGVEYSHSTYNGEELILSNISEEIVVSCNHTSITLDDVTGPMSIKTVYGSIEGNFKSLNQDNSISLNSVYGLVDIALPSSSKARLSLRTPYGQIYTDFDIDVEQKDGLRELSSKKVNGTINSGGVEMSLKSNYENIYLRKK